MAIAVYTDPET